MTMTTKTDDIKLLPCPFCGGPARFSRNDELVNVRCEGWNPGECLGAGPNCYTEVEAAAGWNRRAAVEADRQHRGEPEIRRLLCVAYAGAAAYMDDGEAQDNRTAPFIDFLRDSPAEIQRKMTERTRKAAVEADRDNHLADVRKMVPSDVDILELWSGDPTHSRPIMGKDKVLAFARALLSKYGNRHE